MRIAVGGIVHETNTYAVEALGVTGIDRFDVHRREHIMRYDGTRTFVGCMIAAARDGGHRASPTRYRPIPSARQPLCHTATGPTQEPADLRRGDAPTSPHVACLSRAWNIRSTRRHLPRST